MKKLPSGADAGAGARTTSSTPSRVIERYAAAIIRQSNSEQSTKLTESEDDEDGDEDVIGVDLVPDEYDQDDHQSRDDGSDVHNNEVSEYVCPVSPSSRRNQQSAMLRKARIIRANRHSSTQHQKQHSPAEEEEEEKEIDLGDEHLSHPQTNDGQQPHGQDELVATIEDGDDDVDVDNGDRLVVDVVGHTMSPNEVIPAATDGVPDPTDDELDVAHGLLSESIGVEDEGGDDDKDDVHDQVSTNDNDENVNVVVDDDDDDNDGENDKCSSEVEVDARPSKKQTPDEGTDASVPGLETQNEPTTVDGKKSMDDAALKTPDVSFEENQEPQLPAAKAHSDMIVMDGLNSDPNDLSFHMMSNAQQTPESSNLSKTQVISSTSAFDAMRKHGKQSLGIRPSRVDEAQKNDSPKEGGIFSNRPGGVPEDEFLDEKKDDHSLDSKSTFDSDYSGPSQNSWIGPTKRAKKGSRDRKRSVVNDNPVGFAVSMAFDTIAGFANDNADEDIRSRRHRRMRDDDSSVGSGSNIISEMHDALLHAFGCAMKGGASSVLFDDDTIATDTFSDLGSIPASRTSSRNARHKRTSSDQSNSLVTDRSSGVSSSERRFQGLEDDTTTSELADFSKRTKRVRSYGEKPPLPSKVKRSPNRAKGRSSSARESVASSVSTPIYSQDFFGDDKDAVDLLEEADSLFSGEEMLKVANEKVDALVASIQNLIGKPVSTKDDTTVSVSAEKKGSDTVLQVSVPNTAEETTCSRDSGDASEGLDHLRQDLEKAREDLGFTEASGIEAATLVPTAANSFVETAGMEAATLGPTAANSFIETAGMEAATLGPSAASSFVETAGVEAVDVVPAPVIESILPDDAVLDRHGFPVEPLHPENENPFEALFATKQEEAGALSMALSSFPARIEEETDVCVRAEEDEEETKLVEEPLPPPKQSPTSPSIPAADVPVSESTIQSKRNNYISNEDDPSDLHMPDTGTTMEAIQPVARLGSGREVAVPKAKKSSIAGRFKGLLRPFRKGKNRKKAGGKASSVQSLPSSKIASSTKTTSSLKDKSGISRIQATKQLDPQPAPISTVGDDGQLTLPKKNALQSRQFEEQSQKNEIADETVTTDENWTSFEEDGMSSPQRSVHNIDFTSNSILSPPTAFANSTIEDRQTMQTSLSKEENVSSKLEFDRSFEVLRVVANEGNPTSPVNVSEENLVVEIADRPIPVGAEFLGDVVEGQAIDAPGGDGWKTPDQSPVQSLVNSPDVNWDHVLKNSGFAVNAEFIPTEEKKERKA